MKCPSCRRGFPASATHCPFDQSALLAPLTTRAGRPMSMQEAGEIVTRVAEELERAHTRGPHLRVHPGAIHLRHVGAELSLLLDPAEEAPPAPPEYATPERARGEAEDPRADLYQLGLLLHHLLATRPPFAGSEAQLLKKHAGAPPPSLLALDAHDVPVELEALAARLLAKQAADRPASATEVLALLGGIDLGATLPGTPLEALVESPRVEATRERGAQLVAPQVEISGSTSPTAMTLPGPEDREVDPFGATVLRVRPPPLSDAEATPIDAAALADTHVRVEAPPVMPPPRPVTAREAPAPRAATEAPAAEVARVLGVPALWVLILLLLLAAILGGLVLWLL